jgi:hypothetical protein
MFNRYRKEKTPSGRDDFLERAPQAQPTGRYQCADMVSIPAGSRWGLVYSKSGGSVKVLPREVAALLMHCQGFETLERHTANYLRHVEASRNPWDAQSSPLLNKMMRKHLALVSRQEGLQSQLAELAKEGFLTSDAELTRMCRTSAGDHEAPARISSVVIATRDRAESLERALTSCIEECRCFGRKVSFVVADRSETCDARDRNRDLVRSLKSRYGVAISYADRGAFIKYAGQLAAAGDFPPEIVNFCLYNPPNWGMPSHPELKFLNYGACSNGLLLHTAGETILQVDDDTICRVARPPESRDSLALTSSNDPTDFWFFHDREAAFKSANYEKRDLLELHEKLLGASVGRCVAGVSEGELDFEGVRAPFVRRVLSGSVRVRVTSAGVLGDSGLGSPLGCILLRGSSWERLTKSQPNYLAAITQRTTLRAVGRCTISDALPCFSSSAGLDNRVLLPPFPPVQRNHDGVFISILAACFDDACFGSLPWALVHDPLEPRAFSLSDLWDSAAGFRSGDLLRELIIACGANPGGQDDAERLRALGRRLVEIGSLPPKAFEEVLWIQALHMAGAWLSAIELRLRESQGKPEFWAADLQKVEQIITRESASERYSVPRDFKDHCAANEAREIFQHMVYMFGRLLCCWPDMVETARKLRAQGCRLACEV